MGNANTKLKNLGKDTTGRITSTVEQKGIGDDIKIQQLFKVMVENQASDLHLSVNSAPAMRINGEMVRVKVGTLTPDDTKRLVYQF